MKTKSRITSILNSHNLDQSVTGIKAFDLSELNITSECEFPLPTNLRLGHLVEKIVSELIQSSNNYKVHYENVQLIDAQKTIGEIDFIIEEINLNKFIHLELAYKFYLYDPSISTKPFSNWIGPNRNDSLEKKLEKLKSKQFPLLRTDLAKSKFKTIEIENISQALCFLVSLFIPFGYQEYIDPSYNKAVKGYYLNYKQFVSLNNISKQYYLPSRTEWGIAPNDNEIWADFDGVVSSIHHQINQSQCILCWQKFNGTFSSFFIVWW